MRRCELEKLTKQRNNPHLNRSGEKISCYLDGITPSMIGSIIELRKVSGSWALNAVNVEDIECHQVKRNSYVGIIESSEEVPLSTFEEANEPKEKQ